MGIIFKFILRNIWEKKFRTFLILFAITLSTALFFASISLSGTLERTFMERIKKYIGTADIVIHPNRHSPDWAFLTDNAKRYADRLEYAVGSVEMGGVYKNNHETVEIDLKGFNLDELNLLNPFFLKDKLELEPFSGKKIIISSKTAEQNGLQIGDNLEIELREVKHRFRIVGIAEPYGLFQEDGHTNTAVAPLATIARISGIPGKVSLAYLKVKDPIRIQETIGLLSKEYRRYTVREPFSKAELKTQTDSVTIPFIVMVLMVLFISVFIIYSSFKVITRERLPVIGTFRSIGATRRTANIVLFAESLVYGFIGGVSGCLLGLGILKLMAVVMTPNWLAGVKSSVQYSPGHLWAAFALALVLPFVGSFLPVVKISRIPVKDIILNTMEKPERKRSFKWLAGIFCLLTAIIPPFFAPKETALIINVISMLAAVAATVFLVPYLTAGFLKLFERIYRALFGNEGVLAAKNLRDNKSILNNISLLAIGISSLLLINTINFSVIKEIANFSKDGTFDIWMWHYQANRRFEAVLRSIDGVKGVYGVYVANQIEIDGYQDKISLIHGINPYRHLDFWNLNIEGDREKVMGDLDNDRKILVAYILKDKLGVEKGDLLTLNLARGKRTYQVVGFFDSLMCGGNYALVSSRFLKLDMSLQHYGALFLQTSKDPNLVAATLQKRFKKTRPWVRTMGQISEEDLRANRQMFVILQGFSIMTLIIGVCGVFNNLVISFIERKRSLAMMRSVGMSKRQTLKMILIESLTGGVIGGSVGIFSGTLLISLAPFLLKAINKVVPIHYSLKEYLISFSAGILVTVAASISPGLKSSQMNIIEAIKYE
jgi:putative ABC transport system permease protein